MAPPDGWRDRLRVVGSAPGLSDAPLEMKPVEPMLPLVTKAVYDAQRETGLSVIGASNARPRARRPGFVSPVFPAAFSRGNVRRLVG